MVIYEVNLELQAEIAEQYVSWLSGHVNRILAIPGFTTAKIFTVEQTPYSESVCVQYEVQSQDHLQAYFSDQAPVMQREALEIFGDKFSAKRRVLSLSHSY